MKQVTGLFRCKRNGSIGLYGRYAERCTHGVPHTLVKQISTFFFVVSKIIFIFAAEQKYIAQLCRK